jgi:hypothetical protein
MRVPPELTQSFLSGALSLYVTDLGGSRVLEEGAEAELCRELVQQVLVVRQHLGGHI